MDSFRIVCGALLRDMRHSHKSRTNTSGWSLRTKRPCSLIVLKRVDGSHCNAEVPAGSRQPTIPLGSQSQRDEVRCASVIFSTKRRPQIPLRQFDPGQRCEA
jgi:hypothetical protein